MTGNQSNENVLTRDLIYYVGNCGTEGIWNFRQSQISMSHTKQIESNFKTKLLK